MIGWAVFAVLVFIILVLDLFVFHRNAHEIKIKEALAWSAVWIAVAMMFNAGVYFMRGPDVALQFFTGYLLEKSLSIDNLFIFLMVFTFFRVPSRNQHDVLFWGIVGAVIMRGIFIAAGVTLLHQFHWMIYIFGIVLIITAIRLLSEKEREFNPHKNPVLRIFRRMMPVTDHYVDNKFFVRRDARWFATPLFVVLLVVETTDVIFALDSIPAILAISHDPFIVYTSNIFAILGLRSLYFALAGVMQLFCYLHVGLAGILFFVGVKMLIEEHVKIPVEVALSVIACILGLTIVASVLFPKKKAE